MTEETYIASLDAVVRVVQYLSTVDLAEMQTFNEQELSKTTDGKDLATLIQQRELIDAVLDLKDVAEKIQTRAAAI